MAETKTMAALTVLTLFLFSGKLTQFFTLCHMVTWTYFHRSKDLAVLWQTAANSSEWIRKILWTFARPYRHELSPANGKLCQLQNNEIFSEAQTNTKSLANCHRPKTKTISHYNMHRCCRFSTQPEPTCQRPDRVLHVGHRVQPKWIVLPQKWHEFLCSLLVHKNY